MVSTFYGSDEVVGELLPIDGVLVGRERGGVGGVETREC
jgi:hypothetical protein